MLAGQWRRHHPLTHRLEDLGLAEIRNQQAERLAGRPVGRADVGAGSDATLDEPGQLQLPDGAADRDSRRAESDDELGFAREPIARLPAARLNLAMQGRKDLPVLGIAGGAGSGRQHD